ncbi:hypothetical protein [Paenibacillus sp. 481]|uniref:hypothetical protein n=1 Tax=Paenibacillus sp. 481 TaxID=2835869 RepID=UPI001E2EFAF2|nr:hypothetical protein [Paenibacillus sp. 481]UHA72495.1 hypothetical protein KIK04_17765 [Paenibacillus sp. 481]
MLWMNPIKRFKSKDLNFQLEKIKIPVCDEMLHFVADNQDKYAAQSAKPIADYKELLMEHIGSLERDFIVLEGMVNYVTNQKLASSTGVSTVNNVSCSVHFLNNEYTIAFSTGYDRRYKAYKYGLIRYQMGNKRNSIIEAEIVFVKDQIHLEYTIGDYILDLFSQMNDATHISHLREIHDSIEKKMFEIFRITNKNDLYNYDSEFGKFYGYEPYIFLRDKYQLFTRNKIKLELRDKGITDFNEFHIELVRMDRELKSWIDEQKDHIELMGEDYYNLQCNEMMQERSELIAKLQLEDSELELLLSEEKAYK